MGIYYKLPRGGKIVYHKNKLMSMDTIVAYAT